MYDFIRSNGISILDNIDILIKDNKITENIRPVISAIEIGSNIKGNYKFWDIKYHHKYFSMVNAATEIDQNEFDSILSKIDLIKVDEIFDFWLKNGKYDDLDKKLRSFFNESSGYIDSDLLLFIDNKMASGPYSRHSVYEPVIKYLLRALKDFNNQTDSYIEGIKQKLDDEKNSRNINYYLADHIYSEERCDIIIGKFISLIANNRYYDNQLFYFIQNIEIWMPNLIGKDVYSESYKKYEKFRNRFKEKAYLILTEFAKTNIVEFLQNFSMPNIVNHSDPVYLIYDNLIPELIDFDDVIDLLKHKEQTDSMQELINFVSMLKESTRNGGDIVFVRDFTFKHNPKIIDKS